jgi:hypothetical protein
LTGVDPIVSSLVIVLWRCKQPIKAYFFYILIWVWEIQKNMLAIRERSFRGRKLQIKMAPLKSRIFSIDNNSEWIKFSFIHWNRYKSTGIASLDGDRLIPLLMTLVPIPQACLEMISCQCSTGCITLRCSSGLYKPQLN